MTIEQLIEILRTLPATARVVIQNSNGEQAPFDIDSVCGEDIVPPDVDTNPNGQVINGMAVIIPGALVEP